MSNSAFNALPIVTLTGDVTGTGIGSFATTLATVNSNVGTVGSGNGIPVLTINAKGLITGASTTTSTPAISAVTGMAAGISTFLQSPSSAALANAITDETGTGVLVFGTSPTFTTQITSPTVHGSGSASGSLTLSSTSNATKGTIIFGSTSAYDQANDRIGIGLTNPDSHIQATKAHNSGTSINMLKTNFDGNWGLRLVQNYVGAGEIRHEWKHTYNATEYDVLAFKAGNVGIGTPAPNYRLHVAKTATNGDATSARQLAIGVDNSTNYNLSLGYYFDGSTEFAGVIQARDNNNGSSIYLNPSGGGVVVGAPTGGSKGTGTINAQAVYDDNVLLTCYPLEQYLTGSIDLEKWDALVAKKSITKPQSHEFTDENGNTYVSTIDVVVGEAPQINTAAHGFIDKMNRVNLLNIDEYVADWTAKRSLSAFYGFEVDKKSTGEAIQRIMETLDIFAVHIKTLNDEIKMLKTKLEV